MECDELQESRVRIQNGETGKCLDELESRRFGNCRVSQPLDRVRRRPYYDGLE